MTNIYHRKKSCQVVIWIAVELSLEVLKIVLSTSWFGRHLYSKTRDRQQCLLPESEKVIDEVAVVDNSQEFVNFTTIRRSRTVILIEDIALSSKTSL